MKFIISLFCLWLSVAASAQPALSAPANVAMKQTIRVAVNEDIYPYVYLDAQQQPVGLMIDFWRMLATTANIEIQFVILKRQQLLDALSRGDIEVLGVLSKTPERDAQLAMGEPVVTAYNHVFIHRDLMNIVNLQQLRSFVVGSLKESSNSRQLRDAVSDIVLKEYSQTDEMYDAALRGDIKAFNGQDLLSPQYPHVKELSEFFPSFRKIPLKKIILSWGLLKKNQALADKLNAAFKALPNGFVEKLERRYLAGIKDENTLVLAVPGTNPPLTSVAANGQPQGLLIDLWQLWSKKTGVPVAMLPDTAVAGLKNLQLGRADAHMAYPISHQLPDDVIPVAPVYRFYSSFYYKPSAAPLDLLTLKQPVGVYRAAGYVAEIQHDFPALQVKLYDKFEDMQRDYDKNVIVGFFLSDLVMQHRLLQTNPNGYVRLEQPRYQSELQVLINKDSPQLIDVIRDGFSQITQDELQSLEQQWLSRPEQGYYNSFREQVPLSAELRSWIKQHNTIRVGVMSNWRPMEFIGEDGEFKGVTQDILHKLNQRLGTNLVPVPYSNWTTLVDDFMAGKLDVVANMANTELRRQHAVFSMNYWPFQWAIIGNNNAISINSLRDLSGELVALEKDYDIIPVLEQQFSAIRLKPTANFAESLQLLNDGDVRFVIEPVLTSGPVLRQPQNSHLRMHLPNDMPATPSLFAIRKDWQPLQQIMDLGLRTINDTDRVEIMNKWSLVDFSPDVGNERIFTVVLQVLGAGCLLFGIIFVWNLSLRKEVNLRRQMEQKMRFMATHDDLTQLANRALLHERLEQALLQHARHQEKLALLFIDLDGFKAINDNYGHHVGDELLTKVAGILRYCVRKSDTVARFGGDEFVILLTGLLDRDDAAIVAEKILQQLSQAIQLSVCQAQIGASIGIAIYPDDGSDHVNLMRMADGLMYLAKQAGKGHYRFHSETVTTEPVSI